MNISRILEDVAFMIGVLVLAAFAITEILPQVGIVLGDCGVIDTGTPWGVFMVGSLLVAPKMLGRATAGKIWSMFPWGKDKTNE